MFRSVIALLLILGLHGCILDDKDPPGKGDQGVKPPPGQPDGGTPAKPDKGTPAPKPDKGTPAPKPDKGTPPCKVPCGAVCCKASEVCVSGTCVPAHGSCKDNDDCINDTYCHASKTCVPWWAGGSDGACKAKAKSDGFQPALQCAWTAPPSWDKYPKHKNVLGTPMVVDFNIPGKGSSPSIVFVSYDRLDGGGESARCDSGAYGIIRVIRGKDCQQLYTVEGVKVRGGSPLAIGDLDQDSFPDIVAYRCGGGLVAVTYDKATDRFKQMWVSTPATAGAKDILWSGPSIHDLDDDGKPEVLMGGTVFDHSGKLIDGHLGLLPAPGHNGGFAVVADVDADGTPELVTGQAVYGWSAASNKWVTEVSTGNARGLVAVADFGTYGKDPSKDDRATLDGIAEIAVVQNAQVVVVTVAGRVVFGPVKLPGGGSGGAPTVGDFDNDGRVEMACAGYASYTVFDPDCKPGALKKHCASFGTGGILWSRPSQDHSSSSTGSSVFDFEGDGKAEAIYADECFTRVYSGESGEVVFSRYRSSCTWFENPVVADVDGDYASELIIPSNANCSKFADCTKKHPKLPGSTLAMDPLFRGLTCKSFADCPGGACDSGYCRCSTDAHCGGGSYKCGPALSGTPGTGNVCRSVILGPVTGIQVYRDMKDAWVGSRTIWNQHTYAVTHVGDDGSIPRTSKWARNWTTGGLNNFRQNKQTSLGPAPVPDFTAEITSMACTSAGVKVAADVCNRGAKAAASGVSVTVYINNTNGNNKVGCITQTQGTLAPGQCEAVSCAIPYLPGNRDIYAVPDDDGTGQSQVVECWEKNNPGHVKGVTCP